MRWRRGARGEQSASDDVTVRMTHDQALVLFEWFAWLEDEDVAVPVVHPAERQALYRLAGSLDPLLLDPFLDDYGARLAAARARLAPAGETD